MRFSLEFGTDRRGQTRPGPLVLDTEKRGDPLENPSISLADPQAFAAVFGNFMSATGEKVTIDKALGVPAIWLAVHFLSSTFATLPIQAYTVGDDGKLTPKPNDPIAAQLAGVVNEDLLTSFKFRRSAMQSVLTVGRSLTFVERNKAGKIMNFWPLDPQRTNVERVNNRTVYTLNDGGLKKTYAASEVIDLAWMLKSDGVKHYSPVETLRDAIGLLMALTKYASKFFQNGGIPPLALQGKMPTSPGAISRAAADIADGLKAAQRDQRNVMVLPDGYTLAPIGINPDEGQLVEARKFGIEEAARIYNLPPSFLHHLSAGILNVEQQDLNFAKHAVLHWVGLWESELNAKLIDPKSKTVLKFDLSALVRGDFKTLLDSLARGIQSAVFTPNEARAKVDLEPLDGGAVLYMNGAIVPIAGMGEADADPDAENGQSDPADAAGVMTLDPDGDGPDDEADPADTATDLSEDPAPAPAGRTRRPRRPRKS